MIGDELRLFGGTAVGPANGHGEAVQAVGLDADFAHGSLPFGHLSSPLHVSGGKVPRRHDAVNAEAAP
jgi:hypothetical protein